MENNNNDNFDISDLSIDDINEMFNDIVQFPDRLAKGHPSRVPRPDGSGVC